MKIFNAAKRAGGKLPATHELGVVPVDEEVAYAHGKPVIVFSWLRFRSLLRLRFLLLGFFLLGFGRFGGWGRSEDGSSGHDNRQQRDNPGAVAESGVVFLWGVHGMFCHLGFGHTLETER